MSDSIFLPGLAMVALTFIVGVVMFQRRVTEMKRDRIHPQKVATSSQAAAHYKDVAAADNFRNLFEMPVLFYFALVVAAISGQTGPLVLGLAWAYAIARVSHSAIHCSYNKVMHRFRAFAFSFLALVALWCVLGYGLIAG